MSDRGPGPPTKTVSTKLLIKRYNERIKLTASALDRLSTVVFGGAVLAPIFQNASSNWREIVFWSLVAISLHLFALVVLTLTKEEI